MQAKAAVLFDVMRSLVTCGGACDGSSKWTRNATQCGFPRRNHNSSPVFGTDKERFVHEANSLLEGLRLQRGNEPERPLIMMGHSLGGILIKQALVNAHNNPKYKAVKDATFAIVFFGTPHAGPSDDLKIKFSKACVSIAQSLPWRVSNDIMEALKRGSLFSDLLHENWKHQLEQYRFLSFYEGVGSIVPRESALLGLGGEREHSVRLIADHSNMCRFNPDSEIDMDNYFLVEKNIVQLCEQRPASTRQFQNILGKLRDMGSNPRQKKISNRHAGSFQWIWDSSVDGPAFWDWLKSSVPIYWITGLPGCGKSTLMKYLYNETGQYLRSSPGHVEPIITGYFFYELGESQEQTFESFLASFLSQILTAFEGLASLVLPLLRMSTNEHSESQKFKDFTPFPFEDLQQALLKVADNQTTSGNVMLFLDGLDECSGNNRTQVQFLIQLVELSKNTSLPIRLCLASRSLPEIEPKLMSYPRCRIHEWTANDISKYVTNMLSGPWSSMEDYRLDQNLQEYDICQNIVSKAGGVFLWVEVVVNNLIIGLEEGDTKEELMECIESLPSDLEKLYDRIIQQIPSKYIHDTFNYINIVESSSSVGRYDRSEIIYNWELLPTRPPSITLFEFALAVRDPKESLTTFPLHTEEAHDKFKAYCELLERRIKSRCRGLLYVREERKRVADDPEARGYNTRSSRARNSRLSEPSSHSLKSTVEFLHLTVRKYVMSVGFMASIQAKSEQVSTSPVSERLMAAALTILKMMPPDMLFQRKSASEKSRSQLCLFLSRQFGYPSKGSLSFEPLPHELLIEYFKLHRLAERDTGVSQSPFLIELYRICTIACKDWHSKFMLFYITHNHKTNLARSNIAMDLFSVSVTMGLNIYVREELESFRYKPQEKPGLPLLRLCFNKFHLPPLPNALEGLTLLLSHGAQPNQKYRGKSSWQCALDSVFAVNEWKINKEWLMLMRMLEFGADPTQCLSDGSSPPLRLLKRMKFNQMFVGSPFMIPGGDGCFELFKSFMSHEACLDRDMKDILEEVKSNPKLESIIKEAINGFVASKPDQPAIRQNKK